MQTQKRILQTHRAKYHKNIATMLTAITMMFGLSNTLQAQSFAAVQTNPFSLSATGQIKEPVFVDIDNDGDLDIFSIRNTAYIVFWKNNGTTSSPSYAAPQTNPYGITPSPSLSISFADLNGDGTPDLLKVDDMGNVSFLQNIGSPTNPNFGSGQPDPFGLAGTPFTSIALGDLDKDGVIDLIDGTPNGDLNFYKNFGTTTNPSFTWPTLNPFNFQTQAGAIFPELGDIDGDNDLDIICGTTTGDFIYYVNSGNLNPDFSTSPQTNPFGLTALSSSNNLCIANISGDAGVDIMAISINDYTFNYFENSLVPTVPNAPNDQTPPTDKLICSGTSTTLIASGSSGGIISWYSASTGGTYLGAGNYFTTGILTSNTSFFAQDSNSIGAGPRRAILVEMKTSTIQPWSTTAPADLKACVGGTTTLSVNGEPIGNITWWSAATGGTHLGNGNPFTTPVITGETTFYVQDSTCGGVTPRTPITVTIKQTPPVPMNTSQNWAQIVCPGDVTALQGYSTENGNLSWWSASTGGIRLGNGENFVTPAIFATTTYYLQDSTCGGISTRLPITVSLNIPAAPTNATPSNNMHVCSGSATTINGSGSGSLSWWTAATGGTFLYAGAYFYTGNINSATTYYLQDSACGGASVRTPITVSMDPPPAAPAYSSANLFACLGNSTDLHGYGVSGGALSWWTASTGGTRLYNGTIFNTPAVNAPTTFYLQDSACGGVSARTAIAVTLAQPPAVPTITNWGAGLVTCVGGTVNLNGSPASGWGNFSWWSAPTGGTRLYNGNPFTTPQIFAPTTFYLQDSACGGPSLTRASATITLTAPPPAPSNTTSAGNLTACFGGTTTLSGSGESQWTTLTWWSAPVGGTLLHTGANFTTPNLFAQSTFYLQDSACGGISLTRSAITVTLTPPPPAPANSTSISNMTACPGNTTTLHGTGVLGGALSWWSTATGGTLLGSGSTFITPAINSTTTYYLQDSACGGLSSRTAIVVMLKQFTSAPANATSNTNMVVCQGSITTLTGSGADNGQLTWWSAATGGTLLGSGTNFTTPVINAATTFYLQDSTCVGASARTAVTVLLNTITVNTPPANASVYFNQPHTFSVSATGLNLTYQWTVNSVNVAGATSNTYTSAGMSSIHTDTIRCVISNGCSTVTTNPALLSVESYPIYVDGANGNDIYDGTSWQNAYKTIAKALQVATSGNQIFVKKGIYTPTTDENYNAITDSTHKQDLTFKVKSGVRIYGGFAGTETYVIERINFNKGEANETILKAAKAYILYNNEWKSWHIIKLVNANTSTVIDGFTIDGATGMVPNVWGGWPYQPSDLEYGGGIYNLASGNGNSSNPTLTNCYISNNSNKYGGGIINWANNGASCNPTITKCTFANNSGYNNKGSAVYNYCTTSSICLPVFENCKFVNNAADAEGAAFENWAESGTVNASFTNCQISGNSSHQYIGGIGSIIVNGSNAGATTTVNLINCVISKNQTSSGVTDQVMWNGNVGTTVNIKNSIIWDNGYLSTQTINNGATLNVRNSLIQDYNDADTTLHNLNGVANTSNVNYPKFLNPANKSFRLTNGSPCIDAGLNSANSLPKDLAGTARIYNGTIDMGAFEGSFAPCNTDTTFNTVTSCQGTPVIVADTTFSSSGMYMHKFTNSYGCDSIVKTTVTFYQPQYSSQDIYLCFGESVTVGSSIYNTTGEYYDTFSDVHGCDSTVTTYVSMKASAAGLLSTAINSCSGTPITLDADYDALGFNDGYAAITPTTSLLSGKAQVTFEAMIYNANPNAAYSVFFSPVNSNYSLNLTNNSILMENGDDHFAATFPSLPVQKWTHVAFVFDGSATALIDNCKVFVNGIEQTLTFDGTSIKLATTPISSTQFMIGNNFSGKMRNTRLWSEARTQAQLVSSMNTDHINGGANYAAEYIMQQPSGSIVLNTSGTGSSYDLPLGHNNVGWQGFDTTTCWMNQSYAWSDGISNGVAFTPVSSHDYTVTITNISSGCSMVDTMHVTVNPSPDITTNVNGASITANQTGASYQWINCNNGNAVVAGATGQTYTALANGSYAVVVTLGSCSDTSTCVNITTTGIQQLSNNNQQLSIYPNPNNGAFILHSVSDGNYSIVNELGQAIQSVKLNAANNYSINVENLNNGIYFIIGFNNNQLTKQKVVVTK